MKISNLTEMATPSSMPDNNTSAPKFGRSDEMLESGVGTTTSDSVATDAKPMGKMRTRGQGSMFKGISTSSKYANSRKAGISEDSVNEDELSEEQLQAKKRREENFKKAKDRELGNKPQSREIMAKEAFNGEYDDEAGMFKNNLQTIQRVSTHLEQAIADNENLPEWCQEKIGVAKSMVVTVMDYMISQHENGERPTVDEAGPGIPFRGVGGAFNRGDDERHDLDTPKPTAPQIWGLKINGKVWTKAGKSVTFTSKEAALKSRDSILKTRPDLEIGLVTRGGTTGPQSKTDDNFQAYLAQRKAGQQSVTESSHRVDSLVTDALRIMKGSEVSDAIRALKTVLGDREYNGRRGHYNFYVKQILDMYSQQGVAEELDPEHVEYLKRQADISRNTGLAVGDLVTLKNRPGFEGEIVHDWGGGDFTISGGGGGMSQSKNHRANARLIQKIQGVAEGSLENKYSNLSNRGVNRGINRAGDDFNRMMDLDQVESPHYKTQHQQDTKQRLKTKPMAGPKGVLPEQGVAEESKGLWANIHAKRERIKNGSGEKMRKPGSKGAPTASALKRSAT